MTFWQLNAVFLGIAALVLVAAVLAGRVRRRHLAAIGLAVLVLWALTAIFDNVMIASGLFDYGAQALGGVHVGLAPLEDFAYPLGSAVLLPALWLLLTGRRARDADGEDAAPPAVRAPRTPPSGTKRAE